MSQVGRSVDNLLRGHCFYRIWPDGDCSNAVHRTGSPPISLWPIFLAFLHFQWDCRFEACFGTDVTSRQSKQRPKGRPHIYLYLYTTKSWLMHFLFTYLTRGTVCRES